MTGPEHYKAAERALVAADELTAQVLQHAQANGITAVDMAAMATAGANFIAVGQVHATLAFAAATALAHDRMMPDRDGEQWRQAAATPRPESAPAGGGGQL